MTDIHVDDPQTLYRHREESQWNPFAIDLTADREQWPRMTAEDRELVHWALSSPMVAEERITTKFAGLLLAHGTEEEATFLATQQVDEARHMQFHARSQDEVIADPGRDRRPRRPRPRAALPGVRPTTPGAPRSPRRSSTARRPTTSAPNPPARAQPSASGPRSSPRCKRSASTSPQAPQEAPPGDAAARRLGDHARM